MNRKIINGEIASDTDLFILMPIRKYNMAIVKFPFMMELEELILKIKKEYRVNKIEIFYNDEDNQQ